MKNLYLTALVYLLLLQIPFNSYGQKFNKVDSCKFAIAAGTNMPPITSILSGNFYPVFVEGSYYFNHKTSLDFTYSPLINFNSEPYPPNVKDAGLYLALNIDRHPKLTKWFSLLYGGGLMFYYTTSSTPGIVDRNYAIGVGVSFGFEIKLYKNLYFYDRTDLTYGRSYYNNPDSYTINNTSYNTNYSSNGVILYRVLSSGIKLRF